MSNTSHAIYISIWLLIALVGLPQISETIYTPARPAVERSLQASAKLFSAFSGALTFSPGIGNGLLYILTVWTGVFSEGVTGIVLAFIALFTIFLGVGLYST